MDHYAGPHWGDFLCLLVDVFLEESEPVANCSIWSLVSLVTQMPSAIPVAPAGTYMAVVSLSLPCFLTAPSNNDYVFALPFSHALLAIQLLLHIQSFLLLFFSSYKL